MITYRFRVVKMDVHEWSDDESDNGYVWTKDGYEIGGYHTPQELREALEEHFPGIDVSQEEDAYLHYDQIENEDGYRDDNGGFLVNYLIAVEKVRVDSFFLDAEREAA